MVIACHCIFGTYGFWLPNDPRGSGSDFVASWELFRYGPATKTRGRRSVRITESSMCHCPQLGYTASRRALNATGASR